MRVLADQLTHHGHRLRYSRMSLKKILGLARDVASAPRALWGRRPDQQTFIVGCGHTGSTLLARILYGHPVIHSARYETGAFLHPLPKFKQLSQLYEEAVASGRTMLVEKTPKHVHRVGAIRRWLPSARFIVTARDGRDVVASLARRYGNFDRAFRRWNEDTQASLDVVRRYGALVVRLEDLVASPEREMRRVCDFLELDFSETLLDYTEQRVQWGPADDETAQTRLRERQVNSPIRDTSGRWRSELTPAQVALFDTDESRRLGEALGYAYGRPDPIPYPPR